MPSLQWNADTWDGSYDWSRGGDEWSGPWGSAAAQWYGTLLPRIYHWLPAKTILEIAPGFGRWTQFLIPQCQHFIGIDMAAKCVDACRERFAGERAMFFQNDGQLLEAVNDHSVDFCFSFDSLVHAPVEAMQSYVEQLARKLSDEGVAFLHHSNALEYLDDPAMQTPEMRHHCRDMSTSAQLVAASVESAGLALVAQELLPWGNTEYFLDCLTVFTRAGCCFDVGSVIERSSGFMREAQAAASRNRIYGRS
jgi:SAM-dependent methyltransferase